MATRKRRARSARTVAVTCQVKGKSYEAMWEAGAEEAVCARCGAPIPTKGSVKHPVSGAKRW